jgi:hypothetical protein
VPAVQVCIPPPRPSAQPAGAARSASRDAPHRFGSPPPSRSNASSRSSWSLRSRSQRSSHPARSPRRATGCSLACRLR